MICRGAFGCGSDRSRSLRIIDARNFSAFEFLSVFFAYFGNWFTFLAASKESPQRSERSAKRAAEAIKLRPLPLGGGIWFAYAQASSPDYITAGNSDR